MSIQRRQIDGTCYFLGNGAIDLCLSVIRNDLLVRLPSDL
jgi:hypothetical protein